MAGVTSLVPRPRSPAALERTERRYRLPGSAAAALQRLGEAVGVVFGSRAEARQRRSTKPFVVIEGDRFELYQPWESALITPEGAIVEDLTIGPAVVGRVVADEGADTCVLEIQPRRYAPTPRQAARLTLATSTAGAALLAMVLAAGPQPLLFALAGLVTLGTAVGLLAYRRAERRRDLHELLALVERTFGPLELPPTDPSPHRVLPHE